MKKWPALVLTIILIFSSCLDKEEKPLPVNEELQQETIIEEIPNEISIEGFAWIDAPGGLSMRSEPDLEGDNRLTVIPHGEQVELILKQRETTLIGGREGHWYKVKWQGEEQLLEGWVFGGYLSMEDPGLIYKGISLNGFYMENRDSYDPGFVAILGNQVKIHLAPSPVETIIEEGNLIIENDHLKITTNFEDYYFTLEENPESGNLAITIIQHPEKDYYDGAYPYRGISYGQVSYSEAQTSMEESDFFTLKEDPQDWLSQWFGGQTIVIWPQKLNGFYMVNPEKPMEGFLAIQGEQYVILEDYCEGHAIVEGHVISYDSRENTMILEAGEQRYHLSANVWGDISFTVMASNESSFPSCSPYPGITYQEVSYSEIETSIENSYLFMLEDDPNGWGSWFDGPTIIERPGIIDEHFF